MSELIKRIDKILKEDSNSSFIMQNSSQIKQAIKQLKEISELDFPDENDTIWAKIDKLPYDKKAIDFAIDANGHEDANDIAKFAFDIQRRYGTEPHFVLEAIDAVYKILKKGNNLKEDGEYADLERIAGNLDEAKRPNPLTDKFQALMYKWQDQEGIHNWEMSRGRRNFGKLVKAIGYRDMDEFFDDNSGAYEALVDWIVESGVQEWYDSMESQVGEDEDDYEEAEIVDEDKF